MSRAEKLHQVKESSNTSEPITTEDREFMKQMVKRMPNLSVWHNAEKSEYDGDDQLSGGYLRKFRRK